MASSHTPPLGRQDEGETMKTRTKLAATAIVVIGGLGTAAGVASAQSDPTPSSAPSTATAGSTPADPGAKGQWVCANLAQITKTQADHATVIQDRLDLLASAKQAAQDAGKTQVVAKIDARIAKVTTRQQQVATRQQKVADFASSHCSS
jgi:hypothetical protein